MIFTYGRDAAASFVQVGKFSSVSLFQGAYKQLKKTQKHCMILHALCGTTIYYGICAWLLCPVVHVTVDASLIFIQ